jgi:hypothetical protein
MLNGYDTIATEYDLPHELLNPQYLFTSSDPNARSSSLTNSSIWNQAIQAIQALPPLRMLYCTSNHSPKY